MFKFLLGVSIIGIASPALAELQAVPSRILLTESEPTAQISIREKGPKPVRYRIEVAYYKMKSDGSIEQIPDPMKGFRSAADYFRFSPHQITLDPNVEQIVRLQIKLPEIKLPEKLEEADYLAQINFETTDEGDPKVTGGAVVAPAVASAAAPADSAAAKDAARKEADAKAVGAALGVAAEPSTVERAPDKTKSVESARDPAADGVLPLPPPPEAKPEPGKSGDSVSGMTSSAGDHAPASVAAPTPVPSPAPSPTATPTPEPTPTPQPTATPVPIPMKTVDPQASLKVHTVRSVPVIVRKGNPTAKISLENLKLQKQKDGTEGYSVEVVKSGNATMFADFFLIFTSFAPDSKPIVISQASGVPSYIDRRTVSYPLNVPSVENGTLTLEVRDPVSAGGKVLASTTLDLK